mmetsp:Transcript_37708/g.106921  ORF Transcript_37708/g.106921 Transcript_37708/m.106921 type:complete len:200 (+) Transcript_37708:78-677(+)
MMVVPMRSEVSMVAVPMVMPRWPPLCTHFREGHLGHVALPSLPRLVAYLRQPSSEALRRFVVAEDHVPERNSNALVAIMLPLLGAVGQHGAGAVQCLGHSLLPDQPRLIVHVPHPHHEAAHQHRLREDATPKASIVHGLGAGIDRVVAKNYIQDIPIMTMVTMVPMVVVVVVVVVLMVIPAVVPPLSGDLCKRCLGLHP